MGPEAKQGSKSISSEDFGERGCHICCDHLHILLLDLNPPELYSSKFWQTWNYIPYISELTPGTNRSLVSFTSLVISSDNVNRGPHLQAWSQLKAWSVN